ncbi:MAG TPA: hypothetical protein VK550_12990 [Polyangiaceae bacterium]|jgi:hypothetical protein|nr:hypothetical protein [Polyangiaceae bacterium]
MGIDGIGKGGAPPPASGMDRATSPSATEVDSRSTEFKVGKVAASEAPAVSLDQVRSGAISVSQYLDLKVNEATAHLTERVSAEQFSFIRQSLREQLSADPALIDLVKAATGQLPPPNE